MKIKFLAMLAVLVFSVHVDGAANGVQYCVPVDFPLVLSGNVGEVRSNHFHTGIDIKSGGVVGAVVRAVADGYVSRVGVSPTGYGLVLYVTHPATGEVSVYGHLDRFAPRIAKWVEQRQYQKESFKVDLYPPRDMFVVKKGEYIANLGNSGSSGGPHLHFEVRDALSRPTNVLARGLFRVPDSQVPMVGAVMVFEVDTVCGVPHPVLVQTIPMRTVANGMVVPAEAGNAVTRMARNGFLAYQMIDYKDGRSNTMGVYALEQRVDGVLNFSYKLDKLNFATQRQINAMTDYKLTRQSSRWDVIRAYVAPGNTLHIYSGVVDRGIIDVARLRQGSVVSATVWDDAGNSSSLSLPIERAAQVGEQGRELVRLIEGMPGIYSVLWDKNFHFEGDGMSVDVAAGSLYESAVLRIRTDAQRRVLDIDGFTGVPFQRGMKVGFSDLSAVDPALRSKALVVRASGGGFVSAGGILAEGVLSAQVTAMGRYSVTVDTIAPRVVPLKVVGTAVSYKITDELSGIASYRMTVDGQWVLGVYDPRTKIFKYKYKASSQPTAHSVVVTVVDGRGNKTINKSIVKW